MDFHRLVVFVLGSVNSISNSIPALDLRRTPKVAGTGNQHARNVHLSVLALRPVLYESPLRMFIKFRDQTFLNESFSLEILTPCQTKQLAST